MRQLFFLLAVIGTSVPFAHGAIVVGANGSGILSFSARPSASEWSTRTVTGSDVLFATSNDLSNAVQTNASAISVNTQVLDAGGANPPGQNTAAAWSSGGTGGLWTRPTANGATLLMATLMNGTGADQNALRIAYTLGQSSVTPAEQVPAHQVYYSFSGELGTWLNVPGLSGGNTGFKSNVVAFATTWTNGAPLYVLWIDDNATGGVDRGYSIDDISFSPTTGLGLEIIPDRVVDVLSPLLFRALITVSNGPGSQFTYSLDAGAPATARINPTNGLFHWRPARTDAGTTNSITLRATESGSMLTTTQRFNVAVRDYIELTIGSAVVEVGQQTNVPIQSDSSIPLTNISFAVLFPTNRLVNLALANPVPPIASIGFDVSQPDRVLITIATIPGQFLIGPQQLTGLIFTAAPQNSAFIPLQLRNVIGLPAEPGLAPTVLANDGRVVAVNGEPLLESFQAGGTRNLALYGKPGTNYLLETSSTGTAWQPWQSVTLSNLLQFVDPSAHTNAALVFYRARNGAVAPASLLPQAPAEFKAATKLKKRKIAAALKRLKKLRARQSLPSLDLIP